jgi:broad specificity phosphatase PhoE
MAVRLLIVRHGRTDENARGLLLGRLDVSLDEVGRAQAAALPEAVGPVDRVVSSPLARTMQTAAAFGHDIEVDDRWIELDYGELDGVALADVPATMWADWRRDIDYRPPGGESLAELGARVRDACRDLVAPPEGGTARDETIVVVTHVSPIKAAMGWALDVGDEITWRLFVAPASITRIEATSHGAIVQGFNEVAHLS